MKSFPKLTLILACLLFGIFASCSSKEEPAAPSTQSEKQHIIDMFTSEGFVVVENDENVKPDYVLTPENAEEFLTSWKANMNSIQKNIETASRASSKYSIVDMNFSGPENDGEYRCDYEDITVIIESPRCKNNSDRLIDDAVRAYANGSSFFTESYVHIETRLKYDGKYNYIHLRVVADVTVKIWGITFYQDSEVESYRYTLDFINENAIIQRIS